MAVHSNNVKVRKIGLNRQKTEYEPSKLSIKYHYNAILYYRTLILKRSHYSRKQFFIII